MHVDGDATVAHPAPGRRRPRRPRRAAFATTLALANWHRTHGHCPRCGAETDPVLAGWIRRCPADGSEHYPRTDMAVIMAVVDADDRILLARGRGFRGNGMSVLAGFVEPGETLAAAVAREVAEEVGVEVTDVRLPGRPALAVPVLADARLHRAGARHRPAAAGGGDRGRPLVHPRGAARGAGRGRRVVSGRISISRRIIEHWLRPGDPDPCPDRAGEPGWPDTRCPGPGRGTGGGRQVRRRRPRRSRGSWPPSRRGRAASARSGCRR